MFYRIISQLLFVDNNTLCQMGETLSKFYQKSIHLGHRAVLDGMRGFAVLAVLACHLNLPHTSGGALGVDIFFVLSGFLITSILCEEWSTFGEIRLGQFYLRRILRLYPALLLMVGCVSFISPAKTYLISSLTYSTNWILALKLAPFNLELGHTWTLAIEEQYYLLWPPILILALRIFKPRKAVFIPVLLALISIFIRWKLCAQGSDFWRINAGTDSHADGLFLGSALGMIYTFGLFPSSQYIRKISLILFIGLSGYLLFTIVIQIMPEMNLSKVGAPLVGCTSLLFIVLTVIHPVNGLVKIFEFKPLVWVGTISYGLYLWQVPILVLCKFENLGIPSGISSLIKVILIFLVTIFSYRYIEKPVLQFKRQFKRSKASMRV